MSNKYVTNPPVKAMLYGGEAETTMDTITIRISEATINRMKFAAYVDRKNVSEVAELLINDALKSWVSERRDKGIAKLFAFPSGGIEEGRNVGTGFIEMFGDAEVYPVTRFRSAEDRFSDQSTFIIESDLQRKKSFLNDEYGVTWRLWSWVPTEIQRMAAPWKVR